MGNIAIVISNICASAGTERAVINLANAFTINTDNKIYIISIYSKGSDATFYKVDKSVNIIHLNYSFVKNLAKRLLTYRSLFKDLDRICSENEITVLMGTTHAYNSIISFLKKPIKIGCEHINHDACPRVFRIIRKHTYRNLDRVVLLTNDDRNHYSYLEKAKTTVIPNIRSFFPENPATLINKKIISVGRLDKQKGYDILLQFTDKLCRKIPDWEIHIYGEGEMLEYLSGEIEKKKLGDFIFIENPTKDIQDKMLESSIYLMTSRNEGLPMVLLEAQACGLPIISFDCPEGPKDIINDGEDGFLIPVDNTDLMISRIVQLANSETERRKFGENARIHSENYSGESIVDRWCNLIDEAKERREK